MSSETGVERLRELCEAAARGSFPLPEWAIEVLPPPPRVLGAVVAFTGHHVIAADIPEADVRAHLDPEDIAAPFNPVFLTWLGGRLGGSVGHIDVMLARMGGGDKDGWLQPEPNPPENERVRRARKQRASVEFLAPREGGAIVTMGVGLAGRRELSMEITEESHRNAGLGTRLVRAAAARVAADEAVFASVAPGNVRSLRCLIHGDFVPIGAECIITTSRP